MIFRRSFGVELVGLGREPQNRDAVGAVANGGLDLRDERIAQRSPSASKNA